VADSGLVGKATKIKRESGRRDIIAAQRAAAHRARIRNRLLLAAGAVVAVVAIAVTMAVKAGSPGVLAPPADDGPSGAALAKTVRDISTVPASVFAAVGAGHLDTASIGTAKASTGGGYLAPVAGSRLTAGGKPQVIYVGADFCPYCAALRWPLVVALSRFGSFSGLHTTRSAITNGAGQHEPYPATPTWTFYGATYTSPVLAFSAAETQSNVPDRASGGYTTLQSPDPAQLATMTKYDAYGGIPFVDIGNAYVQLSTLAPYGPQSLQGKTWSQIAAALRDPSSALGGEIDASANYLTAAICTITGNHPASTCTPAITALQAHLGP
jgi:hypothetical protein